MAVVSGQPTDSPKLARELATTRKELEQIKRELVNMPKIPAPAGGGIVGVSRCEALDFTHQAASGISSLGPSSWAVSALYGAGAGVTAQSGDLPGIALPAAGWYSLNASWIMSWFPAGAPGEFSLSAEPSFNPEPGYYYPEVRSAPTPYSGLMQVAQWISHGPFYAPAGGVLNLGAGWSNSNGYNQARAHIDVCRYG